MGTLMARHSLIVCSFKTLRQSCKALRVFVHDGSGRRLRPTSVTKTGISCSAHAITLASAPCELGTSILKATGDRFIRGDHGYLLGQKVQQIAMATAMQV